MLISGEWDLGLSASKSNHMRFLLKIYLYLYIDIDIFDKCLHPVKAEFKRGDTGICIWYQQPKWLFCFCKGQGYG